MKTVQKIQDVLNSTFKREFKKSFEYTMLLDYLKDTKIDKVEYCMGVWFYVVNGKKFSHDDFESLMVAPEDENEEATEYIYPNELAFSSYLEYKIISEGLFDEYGFIIEELINESKS